MATASESDAVGGYRSVSQQSGLHPNMEMNVLGYLWAALVVIFIIPFVPFIALLWVISKLTTQSRPST